MCETFLKILVKQNLNVKKRKECKIKLLNIYIVSDFKLKTIFPTLFSGLLNALWIVNNKKKILSNKKNIN